MSTSNQSSMQLISLANGHLLVFPAAGGKWRSQNMSPVFDQFGEMTLSQSDEVVFFSDVIQLTCKSVAIPQIAGVELVNSIAVNDMKIFASNYFTVQSVPSVGGFFENALMFGDEVCAIIMHREDLSEGAWNSSKWTAKPVRANRDKPAASDRREKNVTNDKKSKGQDKKQPNERETRSKKGKTEDKAPRDPFHYMRAKLDEALARPSAHGVSAEVQDKQIRFTRDGDKTAFFHVKDRVGIMTTEYMPTTPATGRFTSYDIRPGVSAEIADAVRSLFPLPDAKRVSETSRAAPEPVKLINTAPLVPSTLSFGAIAAATIAPATPATVVVDQTPPASQVAMWSDAVPDSGGAASPAFSPKTQHVFTPESAQHLFPGV